MLPPGARIRVIKNSAVKEIQVIQAFRLGKNPCKAARPGDTVVASIKKVGALKQSVLRTRKHLGTSGPKYRRGDLVRALIVRAKKEQQRCIGMGKGVNTGIYVSFPGENAALLLGPNGQDSTKKAMAPTSVAQMMKTRGFSRQM